MGDLEASFGDTSGVKSLVIRTIPPRQRWSRKPLIVFQGQGLLWVAVQVLQVIIGALLGTAC